MQIDVPAYFKRIPAILIYSYEAFPKISNGFE